MQKRGKNIENKKLELERVIFGEGRPTSLPGDAIGQITSNTSNGNALRWVDRCEGIDR